MEINLDSLTLITFDKENKKHLEFYKKILNGLEKRFSGLLPNLMGKGTSFFGKGYLIGDKDDLIGYIDISSYDDEKDSVYLRASVVNTKRGNGYGKLILNEVTDYIFKNYSFISSIRLRIKEDNQYSVKTALSCGYLLIPNTDEYVCFNPYINKKDGIKF